MKRLILLAVVLALLLPAATTALAHPGHQEENHAKEKTVASGGTGSSASVSSEASLANGEGEELPGSGGGPVPLALLVASSVVLLTSGFLMLKVVD